MAKKAQLKTEKRTWVTTTGKRKRAIARAVVRPGSGKISLNGRPLSQLSHEMLRLKVQEPLLLAGEAANKFDYRVNVIGGGVNGQAEAAREAIGRALVELLDGDLRQRYLAYDWSLLVNDPRRTEPHKPPRSSQGPRRHKQRSKR